MMSYSLTTKSSMTRLFKALANDKIVNGNQDATVSINADGFDADCGIAKFNGGNALADGTIDCTVKFDSDNGFGVYLYSDDGSQKSLLFTISKNDMYDIYSDVTAYGKNEYSGFNDVAEKYGILGECDYRPSYCLEIMRVIAGLEDDSRMDESQTYVGAYVLMLFLLENGYVRFTNNDLKKYATVIYRLVKFSEYEDSTEIENDVDDTIEIVNDIEVVDDIEIVDDIESVDDIEVNDSTEIENDVVDEIEIENIVTEMVFITVSDMPKVYTAIADGIWMMRIANCGLSPPLWWCGEESIHKSAVNLIK